MSLQEIGRMSEHWKGWRVLWWIRKGLNWTFGKTNKSIIVNFYPLVSKKYEKTYVKIFLHVSLTSVVQCILNCQYIRNLSKNSKTSNYSFCRTHILTRIFGEKHFLEIVCEYDSFREFLLPTPCPLRSRSAKGPPGCLAARIEPVSDRQVRYHLQ
jgi:hypothetical protein